MKKEDIGNRLQSNVLLFDGAMGTMLYSRGVFINRCFDELNLSRPKLVAEVHRAYVEANAQCIESNTFGANRFKLKAHGFDANLYEINFQGARIAREAASGDVLVAGSIGPLGVRIEPWGPTSVDEAKQAFMEQAKALLDGGVDLFILETFSDLSEIRQAIAACQELCDLPIIASMTVGDDGNSLYGTSPEVFARRLDEWGADVIGVNCSVGPPLMLEALEKMVKVTGKPVSVIPNAGTPQQVESRNIYMASPEYMAEYARRFILAGAKIVGGCCGTTPQYIRAMHNAIRSLVPKYHQAVFVPRKEAQPDVTPVPLRSKSNLGRKIADGDLIVTVEIVPPRGCDATAIIDASRYLKANGVDAVNVPDGPRALSRMGAQHLSLLIQQKVGIETLLHYTCRDRNLLSMMSDMLGLEATGLRNLLIITGDPPKMGDYPDATAVFDVDSIGLVNMVQSLNQGVDLGGNPIGSPTGYLIGVGVNPGAIDLESELRRFEWKVKAGAEFAVTQPVFDLEILMRFLDRIGHLRIPIVAGIWPLTSLRNAEFMNNEVPGAHVPDDVMDRMRAAKTKEEALEEGVEIARETVRKILDRVQGISVSAPFGRVEHAVNVLAALPGR